MNRMSVKMYTYLSLSALMLFAAQISALKSGVLITMSPNLVDSKLLCFTLNMVIVSV